MISSLQMRGLELRPGIVEQQPLWRRKNPDPLEPAEFIIPGQ